MFGLNRQEIEKLENQLQQKENNNQQNEMEIEEYKETNITYIKNSQKYYKQNQQNKDFIKLIDGLNLLAICEICYKIVVIRIGYLKDEEKYYNLLRIKGRQICPICQKPIKTYNIINALVMNCLWYYEGMESNSNLNQFYGKINEHKNVNIEGKQVNSLYKSLFECQSDFGRFEYIYLKVLPLNQENNNLNKIYNYQFQEQ
ncbi:hypothetical protein PPERSA_03591 [Pseudocohnilembus persalinus]|uniref:Uncharacterized protein n=1 Tax=Pseudocohnilembus persalinus TaxID=266149 RepID=A0A0V0QPV3_PSEPJ|nr:hypothetical protein PPERSA_03591 [Pseudocohnilembus persalinus]|eukprot:KRX04351.1 hypothetical protein PPERSA_03591 [Pseudocohnilembus persalinus]